MANCGLITANILTDCVNPLVGGVKDTLILMNASELASLTRNSTNPQIIEAVTKETGKTGFKFEGQRNSIDAKSDFVKSKYSIGYAHNLVFRVFGNNATIKAQLEQLAKGNVIAFLENNFKTSAGDTSFEIYGLDAGLWVEAMETNKSDADTQGAYVITLKTPDNFKEPHLPATLFISSYAASKAVFDGLLT